MEKEIEKRLALFFGDHNFQLSGRIFRNLSMFIYDLYEEGRILGRIESRNDS